MCDAGLASGERRRVLQKQIVYSSGDGSSGYLVEAIVGRNVCAVWAAENSCIRLAEREPFERLLPRRAENDHGDIYCSANVHGACIQSDKQVCEAEGCGELRDGGLSCEGAAMRTREREDAVDVGGVLRGAEKDGAVTETFDVADDFSEAVVVPEGVLSAASLHDEGYGG